MSTLRRTLSLRDPDSWLHSMFWLIVALVGGSAVALLALVAGVDAGLLVVATQLWTAAVLGGSLAAAEITKNPRIISSDRLVERIVGSRERRCER